MMLHEGAVRCGPDVSRTTSELQTPPSGRDTVTEAAGWGPCAAVPAGAQHVPSARSVRWLPAVRSSGGDGDVWGSRGASAEAGEWAVEPGSELRRRGGTLQPRKAARARERPRVPPSARLLPASSGAWSSSDSPDSGAAALSEVLTPLVALRLRPAPPSRVGPQRSAPPLVTVATDEVS